MRKIHLLQKSLEEFLEKERNSWEVFERILEEIPKKTLEEIPILFRTPSENSRTTWEEKHSKIMLARIFRRISAEFLLNRNSCLNSSSAIITEKIVKKNNGGVPSEYFWFLLDSTYEKLLKKLWVEFWKKSTNGHRDEYLKELLRNAWQKKREELFDKSLKGIPRRMLSEVQKGISKYLWSCAPTNCDVVGWARSLETSEIPSKSIMLIYYLMIFGSRSITRLKY